MVKDKIIILGASGFIGMHLCKKLVEESFDVLALIRSKNSKQAKDLLKMGIQIIETGDLFEKKLKKSNFSNFFVKINADHLYSILVFSNLCQKI